MVSAAVNFFIARRYGRQAVLRFVGPKTLDEIDQLSRAEETTLLILARIFGYYFFDVVSYAVGLTRIGFRKYIVYTASFSLIPFGIQYCAFHNLNFNSFGGMAVYYVSVVGTGVLFSAYFFRVYLRQRRRRQEVAADTRGESPREIES
jgi:uncharacterized membrane protein YdjX (TVP38/TMEM64 family)